MSSQQGDDRVVAALYRFVALDDFVELKLPLLAACLEAGVKGLSLIHI